MCMYLKMLFMCKTMLSLVQFTKFFLLVPKGYIAWLMLEGIELLVKACRRICKMFFDAWHSCVYYKCCYDEYWGEKWTWRSIDALSISNLSNSFDEDGKCFVRDGLFETLIPFLSDAHCSVDGLMETFISKEFIIHNIIVYVIMMFHTPHAFNELRSLDYNIMRIEMMNFLLVRFDVDILFEFPLNPQTNGAF